MFRNMAGNLVLHEQIKTTDAKAKELRPIAEKVVTQARVDSLHARRMVNRWLTDRELVGKLFAEISPRFAERPGGYLRIVRLGPRKGDAAEMAILEFVEKGEDEEPKKKGKKK